MNVSSQIIEFAKANNGIVTAADITSRGIRRGNLKALADSGRLEKTARGVYILPEIWEDEFVNLQSRFKKGIFSHETALFLWDLTDRTANRYAMTFPEAYNLTSAKNEAICTTTVKKAWYDMGKTTVKSPGGNSIIAYNMERTLCDLLRKRSGVDAGITAEAFKRYLARKDKNIPLLSQYGSLFHIETKVRRYLEVLL